MFVVVGLANERRVFAAVVVAKQQSGWQLKFPMVLALVDSAKLVTGTAKWVPMYNWWEFLNRLS